MWKRMNMDTMCSEFECELPPDFNIPPPPMPPSLIRFQNCVEHNEFALCDNNMLNHLEYDSISMQATALALLCSVIILIIIFVSSIFIWKYKNKPNVPYKTTSSNGSQMSSSQYNGYETPDDRIISRYNKEIHPHQNHFMMLQTNVGHYPSGFPVLPAPPIFPTSSSPGPDPYESNYNLYEDLDLYDETSERSILSQNDSTFERPSCSSAETTMITSNPNFETINQNIPMNMNLNSHMGQPMHNFTTTQQHLTNANFYAPSFMMTQRPYNSQMIHNVQAINLKNFPSSQDTTMNRNHHHHHHHQQQGNSVFTSFGQFEYQERIPKTHHSNSNNINSNNQQSSFFSWLYKLKN